MILELAIGLAVVTAAGGVGTLWRLRASSRAPEPKATHPAFVEPRRGPRGLRTGDVLTAPGLELALSSMIELDEAGLVLRAFRTIEHEERWVVQLDAHGKRIAVGARTTDVPDGSIPEALPIGGRMLRLERRGTAKARTEGELAPRVLDEAVLEGTVRYAILSERAGRVAIVIDGRERLALRLDVLDIRSVDVLQGGDVPRTE